MKYALGAAFLFYLGGTAVAGTTSVGFSKMRFADAAADACFANCASENASCKRVCPITFSTPCLSACDNRLQTCRQGCQK
jgi:hypothetical protein